MGFSRGIFIFFGESAEVKKELKALQKIMKSDEFWSYVENKAKHYNSGYYGLGRNYLKDFGITFK
jgi:hypothetical protein